MTNDFPESPPPSTMNGRDIGLGMALGRLQATIDHQTPILVEIASGIKALPTQIASQLEKSSPPSVHGAPTTISMPKLSDYTDLAKALAWLALIIGVIFKRIAFPDAAGYLKGLLG